YQSWVYFNEARRWGGNIHLPCVNRGQYMTSIRSKDIYIGFIHVQNLEARLAENIVTERERNGDYMDLEDFTKRIKIGKEQIILLIRINAFRFTRKSKKELLWEAHAIPGKSRTTEPETELFRIKRKEYTLPSLEQN